MSLAPRIAAAAGALGAAGAATLGYALWEARQYTLREVELTLPRIAARPGPLRVLHLSDLHLAPRNTDRIAWIRDLARLPVDLTVVTGDFHGDAAGPQLALHALEPLLYRPRRLRPRVERLLRAPPVEPVEVLPGAEPSCAAVVRRST